VNLTYTYHNLNRMLSVTNPAFNVSLRYEYDAAGNQTKMTTPNAVLTYTYDGKNRLAAIYDSADGPFRFSYDTMAYAYELLEAY
jgi:YD repeat-containing protein